MRNIMNGWGGSRAAAVAAAIIGAAALAGCASTPSAEEGTPSPLGAGAAGGNGAAVGDDGLADYQAGRYQAAYEKAWARAAQTRGVERERAHYVAGMSAYQLDREDDAITHLGRLTRSREQAIAGRANATLGLIYARRGRHDLASGYYQRAVKDLRGEDLAQAHYHLGLSEQKLGRRPSAQTHFSLAISRSNNEEFKQVVRDRLESSGFTLQLGAFSSRENAERQARSMRPTAEEAEAGIPRVVPSTTESGERLFLVQVGRFGRYETALEARERLDLDLVTIVPIDIE